MPYISLERRSRILEGEPPITSGELNFLFSIMAKEYFRRSPDPVYQSINDVLGAFEGAKQEFYRRIAVPYEEHKLEENGDIYV